MVARYRYRDLRTAVSGTYSYPWLGIGPITVTVPNIGREQYCSDVIGNFPHPNGLDITRSDRIPAFASGILYRPNGTIDTRIDGVPFAGSAAPNPSSVLPEPGLSAKEAAVSDLLVRTNPSAPSISVPTFIGELKDIPELVRDWGGSLLRKVAKGHLTWRWAIRPMISDVQKMMQFSRLVDERFATLIRLRDGGFVRKATGLGGSVSTSSPSTQLFSVGGGQFITATKVTTYTSKMWGSVQWKTDGTFSYPRDGDSMRKFAERIVVGATSYETLATTWELLPWSWFVDWFANVGGMIATNNNSVGASYGNMCIMRTISSRNSYTRIPPTPSWITSPTLPSEEYVSKLRYINIGPSTPLSPSLAPLIDGGKWSILGSLAVLKRT